MLVGHLQEAFGNQVKMAANRNTNEWIQLNARGRVSTICKYGGIDALADLRCRKASMLARTDFSFCSSLRPEQQPSQGRPQ